MKHQKLLSAILFAHLLLAHLLLATGCQSSRYAERFGFGTMERQKSQAADFDPYPLNDIGPEVLGGRPQGFFNPTPEPKRHERQTVQNPWSGLGQR